MANQITFWSNSLKLNTSKINFITNHDMLLITYSELILNSAFWMSQENV